MDTVGTEGGEGWGEVRVRRGKEGRVGEEGGGGGGVR